ncbi:MAG TPA: alpha/beta hydrolase [Thermoplasmatales archaeon]|nr:alpha/beta hydrolase [Thermoplasmatales archaeon]
MPFAELDGFKICYYVFGEGEPLILISGLGMDNTGWIYQVPVFKDFFKVIIFDNRGIGKSSRTLGPYTIKMMADDVVNLMKYLGIKSAHILGSSMGGMIAQEIAINYPLRVNKLVLCSTSPRPRQLFLKKLSEGLKDLLNDKIEDVVEVDSKKEIFEKAVSYILLQAVSEEFLKKNKKLVEETFKRYLSNPYYIETFLKQVRAIRWHNTLDRLNLIEAETLILAGDKDRLVSPENAKILAERIPNSKVKIFKNVGHAMHLEIPEKFNKTVLDFLRGSI